MGWQGKLDIYPVYFPGFTRNRNWPPPYMRPGKPCTEKNRFIARFSSHQ